MNNIFPIFKTVHHIIALASRKATYSKFKFDMRIFFVHGIGARHFQSVFSYTSKGAIFSQLEGK